jgi:hypothetical protein
LEDPRWYLPLRPSYSANRAKTGPESTKIFELL